MVSIQKYLILICIQFTMFTMMFSNSKETYENIVLKGYKMPTKYVDYINEHKLPIVEKKDTVYFHQLSDAEKKILYQNYPEEPNNWIQFIYQFKKINFEAEPSYFKMKTSLEKSKNYVQFMLMDDDFYTNNTYMLIAIKNSTKDWFYMGAIEFKSDLKSVILNFESKKIGQAFYDLNYKWGYAEESIAYILSTEELEKIMNILNEESIKIVIYSDYENIKKTRNLNNLEKENMKKMYEFYQFTQEMKIENNNIGG